MKKLRAHSLNTARWIVVFEVISTALVAILFIGCATQPIRGITTPYVGGPALSGTVYCQPPSCITLCTMSLLMTCLLAWVYVFE